MGCPSLLFGVFVPRRNVARARRTLPHMRLFVDELRGPPGDGWLIARTSAEPPATLPSSDVIEGAIGQNNPTVNTGRGTTDHDCNPVFERA